MAGALEHARAARQHADAGRAALEQQLAAAKASLQLHAALHSQHGLLLPAASGAMQLTSPSALRGPFGPPLWSPAPGMAGLLSPSAMLPGSSHMLPLGMQLQTPLSLHALLAGHLLEAQAAAGAVQVQQAAQPQGQGGRRGGADPAPGRDAALRALKQQLRRQQRQEDEAVERSKSKSGTGKGRALRNEREREHDHQHEHEEQRQRRAYGADRDDADLSSSDHERAPVAINGSTGSTGSSSSSGSEAEERRQSERQLHAGPHKKQGAGHRSRTHHHDGQHLTRKRHASRHEARVDGGRAPGTSSPPDSSSDTTPQKDAVRHGRRAQPAREPLSASKPAAGRALQATYDVLLAERAALEAAHAALAEQHSALQAVASELADERAALRDAHGALAAGCEEEAQRVLHLQALLQAAEAKVGTLPSPPPRLRPAAYASPMHIFPAVCPSLKHGRCFVPQDPLATHHGMAWHGMQASASVCLTRRRLCASYVCHRAGQATSI